MSISLDVSWKSLNKKNEELCGDKVEVLKNDNSNIIILSDGMGSGVKANILATLTSKILGTMLVNGATIEECVTTIAKTLPVCKTRNVAYSTFSILQIFNDGSAYLVEYDNPGCIFVRDNQLVELPFGVREIEGKIIREYRFQVKKEDFFVLVSDGVVHAGVGQTYSFGWTRNRAAQFVRDMCCANERMSGPRLCALVSQQCNDLYNQTPGDDTTVAVAKIIEQKTVNIFTGPPCSYDDDEILMNDFMSEEGAKVVSGGTSANIAARHLGKRIVASLTYNDPDIPPTAMIEGLDLVTEGVLTLNRAANMLNEYNEGANDEAFFGALDADNGAARIAKLLIEDCTHLNMFVGQAMNAAHQAAGLPFDLSIRMRLVDKIIAECKKMGKTVVVKYY